MRPLSKFETVLVEVLANAATSWMVTAFVNALTPAAFGVTFY